MIVKRAQLAAKLEGTEGSAETLAGVDAFLAMNIAFKPDIEMHPRDNVSASLSNFSQVPGARKATMEFDVELKGSGTAGTEPALGKLLKACGFGETVVPVTSVTYLPASTGISSITIAMYDDGVVNKIWGARGTVSLKLEKGKHGLLHFVFTGADFSVTDGAMLSSGLAYETTIPQPFLSATLTVDSYAALLGSLDFNMQNEVSLRPDANSGSGHKSAVITGRRPSLSIDPEMVLVATYDFYGKWRSGNQGALTLALTGAAGNICTVTAPKVQYTGVSPADHGGIASLAINCQLNRNAGDDELSIAFT
ncbi:MAG TPA: hypothetical protein DCS11_03425 [Syntrophus sp. (in: bacteria)]|nr:hypothetical protein [Syntrophus sp. (in: bacteria)]